MLLVSRHSGANVVVDLDELALDTERQSGRQSGQAGKQSGKAGSQTDVFIHESSIEIYALLWTD